MVAPVETRRQRQTRQLFEIIKDSGNTSGILILIGKGSGGYNGETGIIMKDEDDLLSSVQVIEEVLEKLMERIGQ